jgi:hypothetical protein
MARWPGRDELFAKRNGVRLFGGRGSRLQWFRWQLSLEAKTTLVL